MKDKAIPTSKLEEALASSRLFTRASDHERMCRVNNRHKNLQVTVITEPLCGKDTGFSIISSPAGGGAHGGFAVGYREYQPLCGICTLEPGTSYVTVLKEKPRVDMCILFHKCTQGRTLYHLSKTLTMSAERNEYDVDETDFSEDLPVVTWELEEKSVVVYSVADQENRKLLHKFSSMF